MNRFFRSLDTLMSVLRSPQGPRSGHTIREKPANRMASRLMAVDAGHLVKVPVIAVHLANGLPLHMRHDQGVLKINLIGNIQVKRP